MNEYMIAVRFSSSFDTEFLSLIPRHRTLVNELMQKGTITSYSLSADRSTLWMTLLASSQDAAEKTLRLMPLYPYMQYHIAELMFHNTPARSVPHFSLN
jgi:muconolactone delta-isomerase